MRRAGRAGIGPVQVHVCGYVLWPARPFQWATGDGREYEVNGWHRRFRKRPFRAPGGNDPFSRLLREIGRDMSKRKPQTALAKANQVLSEPDLDDESRSRILALVADSECMRGRFEEAAQIYLQASTICISHHRLWLRPLLGHVRALLKVPRVDLALTMARHVLDVAVGKMDQFDRAVQTANRNLGDNQAVEVPPLPQRISVVASRLAQLFMQEGEPEIAAEFYGRAVQASPRGGNRAKQGLAKLALAQGDFSKALELSHEAIRQGKYQVKTIPAWPVLISARRRMGGWKIGEKLISGLDGAPAEVRARAILVIVAELRKNDMRQWRNVAERWLPREGNRFPIIAAEIRKLILASDKTDLQANAVKFADAQSLLRTPGLSPQEWLMAAKEVVRSGFAEGESPNLDALLRSARREYGAEFVPKARHGLALACLEAQRQSEARSMLGINVQECAPINKVWAKSVWALAGLETASGSPVSAAALYRRVFEEETVAPRFRLQAQLLWVEALLAVGQSEACAEAVPLMDAVLEKVDDFNVLMNFARQLRMGPPEFASRAEQLFARAETLALRALEKTRHPELAASILFRLSRRQVIDFGRSAKTLETWESFDATKRDWLWSEASDFWEYMGLVFEAYVRSGQAQTAVRFARELLADPATPPHGAPCVGIPFARRLMEGGEPIEGLALFNRLAQTAPHHGLCAWAWYWLALEAHRLGDRDKARENAANVRKAQGVQAGTWNEWQLDMRALLLLADLELTRLDVQAVRYEASLLREQQRQITDDLARLIR